MRARQVYALLRASGVFHWERFLMEGECPVPRIIVTTDPPDPDGPVTLDEQVDTVHVDSDHASRQLLDRVVWAIHDAERVEQATRLTRR